MRVAFMALPRCSMIGEPSAPTCLASRLLRTDFLSERGGGREACDTFWQLGCCTPEDVTDPDAEGEGPSFRLLIQSHCSGVPALLWFWPFMAEIAWRQPLGASVRPAAKPQHIWGVSGGCFGTPATRSRRASPLQTLEFAAFFSYLVLVVLQLVLNDRHCSQRTRKD